MSNSTICLMRLCVLSCFLWGGLPRFSFSTDGNPSLQGCGGGRFFPLSSCSAQETFTQHLTRSTGRDGKVVLYQDAEIEALVNGITSNVPTRPKATPSSPTPRPKTSSQRDSLTVSDSIEAAHTITGQRVRMNGYRIQVYAGGNNRQSKSEAYRMANLVRSTFSDVQVYTHFISPRWICRVGDFKTYEEANDLLKRMRQTQKFREASIVKSKITLLY